MKQIALVAGLLALVQSGFTQEQIPREDALKYAFFVSADLKKLQDTPIPTDVDLKHPVAMKDGDYGALLLPEAKLTAAAISGATGKVAPVGQLWLRQLTLMKEGEAVTSDKLRMVTLEAPSGELADVVQCALGAKAADSGEVELLVYGKDPTPVVRVPMKKVESQQQTPILMDAHRDYESGQIKLKILGKYEATLTVTELQN